MENNIKELIIRLEKQREKAKKLEAENAKAKIYNDANFYKIEQSVLSPVIKDLYLILHNKFI
jgi:hypothetical protein